MMLLYQAFSKFITPSISSLSFHQFFLAHLFCSPRTHIACSCHSKLLLFLENTPIFPYPIHFFAHADFSSLETSDALSTRGSYFKLQTKDFRIFSIPLLALISFFFVLRLSWQSYVY